MYELTQVAGNSYYIQSPAKIGLVRLNDTDVCLIDSGNDKEAGRKVRQILDANGWHLTAIYNTHSNADHIGGNQYLQNQTGCRIYAPGIECDFTRHPVLEPSFLYGGYPPKELQHKFLMAKPSDAQELTPACLPEGCELLPLPGHFFDIGGLSHAGRRGVSGRLSVEPGDTRKVPDRFPLRRRRIPEHAGNSQNTLCPRIRARTRRGYGGHCTARAVQHRQGARDRGHHHRPLPGAADVRGSLAAAVPAL